MASLDYIPVKHTRPASGYDLMDLNIWHLTRSQGKQMVYIYPEIEQGWSQLNNPFHLKCRMLTKFNQVGCTVLLFFLSFFSFWEGEGLLLFLSVLVCLYFYQGVGGGVVYSCCCCFFSPFCVTQGNIVLCCNGNSGTHHMWNLLTASLWNLPTVSDLKAESKTYLFRQPFTASHKSRLTMFFVWCGCIIYEWMVRASEMSFCCAKSQLSPSRFTGRKTSSMYL